MHVYCSLEVSDLRKRKKKKKKEMIRNLLPRPLERWAPYQNERPPRVSHSSKEQKEGGTMERVKLERDVHGMRETPLVRIAFQPWLVHLLRTKRWHPPTLRGNQTCRGKLFDEDRMTSGPSFQCRLPLPRKNYETLYSITRIFHRSSSRINIYISLIKFLISNF